MAKLSKGAAYYRVAENPAESCGTCKFFQKRASYDNGTCELVVGVIEPEDTCDLWVGRMGLVANWFVFLIMLGGAYLLAKGPRQK